MSMQNIKQARGGHYMWVLFFVGGAAVYFTFTQFVALSAFAAAVAKASIAVALFYIFVNFVVKPWINVKEQLQQGNVAFALYLLAYAFLIGLCISTA